MRRISYRKMVMNDELERLWKEAVVCYFKLSLRTSPAGSEETHDRPHRIASLLAENQNWDLPHTLIKYR
jgi:hypothetical protein